VNKLPAWRRAKPATKREGLVLDIVGCDEIEIIIKITERCNINCTYCYMFNRGNDDYLNRPVFISNETIEDIIVFLVQGIADLSVKKVNVVLHGGEPLMMPKKRFSAMSARLRSVLEPLATLNIGLQTNAMLIDEEWIAIFEKQRINIGVSIDGPAVVNDAYRVDKAGRGTHASTVAGIRKLQDAYNAGRITRAGAIAVIDPSSSAKAVYRHIVDELGFTHMSFNLPMETRDTAAPALEEELPGYLSELFDEWVKDDNPKIRVRMFDQMLRYFAGDAVLRKRLPNFAIHHVMAVISADGDLSEHDDFKVINFAQRCGNVRDTTLLEFANAPLREYLHHIAHALPDACQSCDWRNYCRAGVTHGLTVSRYSRANGFNNRSSLCAGFSALFEAGASMLVKNGLSVDKLEDSLGLGHSDEVPSRVRPAPVEMFSHSISEVA